MKFEELRDLIVETLGCDADQVTPEASLTTDLKADSLSLVELVMAMEEEFNVGEIDDGDMAGLKTVGDVLNYLQDHQN